MGWTAARFAAGAVLSVGALYVVSEVVDPVYPVMAARVAVFRERAPRVEALSVGNSHGLALDFAALGMPGMHFWDSGHDAFEAMYLARYAADDAPRLRYVLLTASYGLERLDHAGATDESLRGLRRVIYARTPTQGFIPGDRDLWLAGVFAPVARPDHWAGVAQRILRPDRAGPPLRLTGDGRVEEPPPPPFRPDSLARGAAPQPARTLTAGELGANDPTTPARAVARLEELARDLDARGIRLVLYTPPYHETLPRYIRQRAGGTRRALAPLLAHSNVVWMDFGADPAFMRRDDLFRDSDHMNPAGARVFSTLLRRCLAALDAEGGAAPDPCRRVLPPQAQ